MSRLIGDVGVLQDFVTWSITGLFRSVFILVGIVVAMLLMNWQLALVTFSVIAADAHLDQLLARARPPGLPRHPSATLAHQRLSE